MMRYLPFIIISLVLYTLFFYHNQEPELLSVNNDLSEQIIKQKVIPLDFKEVAKLDKDTSLAPLTDEPNGAVEKTTEPTVKPSAAEISVVTVTTEISTTPVTTDLQPEVATETITVASDLQPKVATEDTTVASKSNHNTTEMVKNTNYPQINIEKMKHFQASIKSTEASDVALIKGEFYERDFHLDLPAPPASYKTPLVTPTPKESTLDSAPLSSMLIEKNQKLTQKTENNTAIKTQNEKPKRVFKKPVKSQSAAPLAGVQVAIAVSGNKPSYPPEAKAEKLQGTVSAKFIVSMQGKSRNAKIITSSGHQVLDNALLKFIANERFMPALKGIEKVTSEQQFTFKFQY
jgi:protein TonB